MAESGLHHAVMGCIVKDEEGRFYGITCEHVTRAADGVFHIKDEFGRLEHVGRSLRFQNDGSFSHDIDIIELNESVQKVLTAGYKDRQGTNIPCRIYKEPVKNLYNREVFHIYASDHSDIQVRAGGTVCNSEIHENYSDIINLDHNFIVQGFDTPFAQEGDSGRLVASISEDGWLVLLGITVAGKFQLESGEISQKTALCLKLNSGLKMLKKFYKKKLSIHGESIAATDAKSKGLQAGVIIWFKTPEQIKQPDFDLCDHLLTLTTCFALKESIENVSLLLMFEIDMSNKVFSRVDVSSNEYSFSQSDQNCVLNSMLACHYLYEKRFEESESHLKIACRMVPKNSRFPVRLLCKIISYATWLLLDMNKLDQMKSLLDAGLEFMEETKHFKSFPSESIGYQYYDYSRYYLRKQQALEAAQMAKRSVDYFIAERRTDGSPNRLILAVSQFAQIKLGCGENFETYDQKITLTDIEEAETCLKQINHIASGQPSVQLTDYLLAVCDLNFRKGNIIVALENAKTCLTIAEEKHLEDEIAWSKARIEKLKTLCENRT